jgi:hypothetical protein
MKRLVGIDADAAFAGIVNAALIAALCVVLATLGGCAKDVPLFVTATTPALPQECNPGNPVVRQVKPDLPGGWASDAVAVRDRETWRVAYRDVQGQRVTCWQRLHVLFPQPPAPSATPRAVAKAPAR